VYALLDTGDALSPADGFDHAIACDAGSVWQAQDSPASEMSSGLERRRQALRQWELP